MKWEKNRKVICGISEKKDGPMKIVNCADKEKVIRNRAIFFEKFGIDIENVAIAVSTHGSVIKKISSKDERTLENTDGLVTNKNNLFLALTVADCLPVYFYDLEKETIGLIHAGWRGITKNIIENITNFMFDEFDSKKESLKVYIGPHIKEYHFEIKDDLLDKFKDSNTVRRDGKIFLDLSGEVIDRLVKLGIKKEQIQTSKKCTYCGKDKYFSFRRDKPENIEAMIAYIGII